jgi:hypothetical protein
MREGPADMTELNVFYSRSIHKTLVSYFTHYKSLILMNQVLITVTTKDGILIIVIFLFAYHIARYGANKAAVSGFVPEVYFLAASSKTFLN